MSSFRISSCLNLLSLSLTLSLPNLTWAQTANLPNGQTLIFNANSQKCMDDPYSSLNQGTKIQQFYCTDNLNQKWHFVKANNGVMIRSPLAKLCLATNGGSKEPQAEIILASCDSNNPNLVWSINANATQFSFTNKASNLCLGVKDQSNKDEARLVQVSCGGSNDQLWAFAKNSADISANPNSNPNPNPNPKPNPTPSPNPAPTPNPAPNPNPAPANVTLSKTGKWNSPFDLGLSATSMATISNGKVLIWAGSSATSFGGHTYTVMTLFDPATNRKSKIITTSKGPVQTINTDQEYFCEGTTILANGNVIVSGGQDANRTSIADANGNWSASSNLNIPRGYAASTLTSTGQVFILGGSWQGGSTTPKLGELYTPGQGWKILKNVLPQDFMTNDIAGQYRADNHMWLFAASNGWVFHAGPSKKMHWINTNGDGSVVSAGTRGNDIDAMNGNAVMYDVNKILSVNGSPNYFEVFGAGTVSKNATLIDLSSGPGSAPKVRTINNANYARFYGHSIVLPNGQVIIAGGAGNGGKQFFDTSAVMNAELWDPATEKFQTLPPLAVPRVYHSIGFLTVDGRVMLAGGNLGSGNGNVHMDAEIFTPPYLLNADGTDAARPSIINAPASTKTGQTISVTSNGATNFALVRASSDTHSLNNDQRRIPLSIAGSNATKLIKASNAKAADETTSLKIPDDPGIVLPGTYFLFAMDDNGTPSIASMINIQ